MSKKINVLDLFCGCGGLSLGFEDAGFNVAFGIDSWSDALKTFAFNHKNAKAIQKDLGLIKISDIKDEGIANIDVIIGGPPCQGFSIAGKRLISDERNLLYKSFVSFVEELQPKLFLMENVPNIMANGERDCER